MRSNPTRRQAMRLAGVAGAALAAPALAQAPWPSKPVHFVVPFPPGQAADIFARLIAEKLTDMWKQQVVVENKAGGSGIPATEYGKNAAPDGYTLMIVSSGTFGVNPRLYPDLPYRPLVDFLPITNIFLVPLVIVANPSFQANTLAELIELARKEPGQLSYASAGPGTSQHLSMELFKMRAKLDIVHIPYKGSKALALTTARRAAPPLDFIPPIADTLPGFDDAGWSGLAAPARTPLEIVAKVNRDVNALLQDPAVVREIERRAGMPAPGSPIQFAEFIKKEIDTWGEVVRATGTKPGT